MIKNKALISLLLILTTVLQVTATEVPRIINFNKQVYQGHNQNWSIAQSNDLKVFVGNSKGLLVFDGIHWSTLPLPNNEIVRAVAVDNQGRIFTGGFASIGYWQTDIWGTWQYTSLVDKIEGFEREEIWHFIPVDDGMLFQSFARMYKFDGEKVGAIPLPGNVMFAQKINGRIILPVIKSGLFEYLPEGVFKQIPGSDFFKDQKIATILPWKGDSWLVGTQKNGIFLYKNGTFQLWKASVNDPLKKFQLNKGLQLYNGNYAFGTIANGVFITDSEGNILHHLNRETGLQNNTVLSLMEDDARHLWVGLDMGLDLIEVNETLKFFQDNQGGIGAVYAATIFENKLYVGTNQGVFFKPWPSRRADFFQLLDGSQGQAWDLQIFDDQLIGAHNNGAFTVQNGQLRFLSNQTGSYTTIAHPEYDDVLLQGTYTGIIVLRKDKQGNWKFSNSLENFQSPAREITFDTSGHLWCTHPHEGLFKLSLDANCTFAESVYSFGAKDGLNSRLKPDLVNWQGKILVKSDSILSFYDAENRRFKAINAQENLPFPSGDYKILPGNVGNWFQVFTNSVIGHLPEQTQSFQISLLPQHERIVGLTDSIYLFCLDNGYALLNLLHLPKSPTEIEVHPLIVAVEAGKNSRKLLIKNRKPQISGRQLRFVFTAPQFSHQLLLSYRLLGFDQEWSPYQQKYSSEYTNLPPGDYQFQVRTRNSAQATTFDFTVLPEWYQSWWIRGLVLLLLLITGTFLLKLHESRLEKQERKLRIEKERELQHHRIEASNERLQIEIDSKSRQLADSTMNLIRKNEVLIKINEELERLKKKTVSRQQINKIVRIIDHHISSEEDWKIFESNFNQLHDQFFKRLKANFPQLTPGDLRLAAYLKMNLSSKEIAPLLNISLRGVENKRYRLRRKMNLDQDNNLTEVLIHF